MNMNYLFLQAVPPEAAGPLATAITFVPMLLIIGVMYFFMIRPQRKREKAVQEMRSKIEVGDEIVTSGGIIGRVVSIRDDSVVLETGSDRSKVRIARWAIQSNNTVHESTPEAK
jgi:preprotein translocase subunit YajC